MILHHGRGADEHDLLPLADVLDPGRRLHVVTPRAPLQLPGSLGYHWYLVPKVGHPDPDTFSAAHAALAELHDELRDRTGIEPARTVLGGFSMGCVMSYALGLDGSRPAPGGILAFSGFIPTVTGWQPELDARKGARGLHRPRPPRCGDPGRARTSRPRSACAQGAWRSTTTSPRPPTTSIPASCPPPPRGWSACATARFRRSRHRPKGIRFPAASRNVQRGSRVSVTAFAPQPPRGRKTARPDRRRRLRRDRRRGRAAQARDHRHRDPREGARPGRDVVPQQLSRRRLRRPQPPLLLLLRPAPRLVAAVLPPAGDPRLHPPGRPRAARRGARPVRTDGHLAAAGTRRAISGRSTPNRVTAGRPMR